MNGRNKNADLQTLAPHWISGAAELIEEAKRPFGDSDGGTSFVIDKLKIKSIDHGNDFEAEEEDYRAVNEYTEKLLKAMPGYLKARLK